MKRHVVHIGLIGAFIFGLALAVSPQLHERIHPDANQPQHECGVTLIAAGNYHHAPPPVVVVRPDLSTQISWISTLTPIWVASPFLDASIFEHAPPALA
jgi:hypothetical protein